MPIYGLIEFDYTAPAPFPAECRKGLDGGFGRGGRRRGE